MLTGEMLTMDVVAAKLKRQIRDLVAKMNNVDADHAAQVVPRYWLLGEKLPKYDGTLDEKYALTKGRNRYYRALRIHTHFPTLAEARAYKGSLRGLLDSLVQRSESGPDLPPEQKAARALIKAARGDVRAALLIVIRAAHYEVRDALRWLTETDSQRNVS